MSLQTHAFQPGNRQCVPAQKRSSLEALCVSGRCFVVARRGSSPAAKWAETRRAECAVPAAATRSERPRDFTLTGANAGVATSRHHKASSPARSAALTQVEAACRRSASKSDAAHDPSGAALCRDRSEPALRPTMRLIHERMPASTNAPPQARSRPDLCFLCVGLAESNHDVGSYGVSYL
jgi:hypothetical protein